MSLFAALRDDELPADFFSSQGDQGLLGPWASTPQALAAQPQPQPQPSSSYDASDDTPGLPWGAASAASASTPSPTRADVATGAERADQPQGLLGKIGHAVFGTHESGTTFSDRLLASAMGLQGNVGGEAGFLQGITDKKLATADAKAKNQAFSESWVPGQNGKLVFDQNEYLKNLRDLGYRGDTMAAITAAKGMRDKYEITDDALKRKVAINPYEPGEKPIVLTKAEDLAKDHIYQVEDTREPAAPAGVNAGAEAAKAAAAASAGFGETAAGVPTSPIEPGVPAAPGAFQAAVGKREGTAKNPYSSASGTGQFLGKLDAQGQGKGTWFDVMRGDPQFAQDIAGKSDAQILALRGNDDIARRAIASYAATNSPKLQAAGITPTGPTLGLAHGYGPEGAIHILKADPATPMQNIIGAKAALINRVYGQPASQVIGDFGKRFASAAPAPAATAAAAPAAAAGVPAAATAAAPDDSGLTPEELKQLGPAQPGMRWMKGPEEPDEALTDDAAMLLAGRWLKGEPLPQMRDLKGHAKFKIFDFASQMAKNLGLTAADLVAGTASLKASSKALADNTTKLAFIKGYEGTAEKNADLALKLAPQGAAEFNNNLLNKWVQTGRKSVLGDPNVTSFDVALGTFLDEYTKVVVGSNGGSGTTDAARKESYDRLSKFAAQGQLASGIATMKVEMHNRTQAMDYVNQGLLTSIRNGPSASGGAAAPAPAAAPPLAPPPPPPAAAPKPPPAGVLQEGRIRTLPNKERWAMRRGKPVFLGMAQ